MGRGVWTAAAAYVAWGLFPFYWKQIADVPAEQVVGHRVFWSFVVLTLIAVVTRRAGQVAALARSAKVVGIYALASALLTANWFSYIWAVNRGDIVQTSLGYFINPLVSVLLGVMVFKERLRPAQWVAIGLAAAGVLYLTLRFGRIPWIALNLAITFAVYGVLKKLAPLSSMEGLTLETAIGGIPAAAFLILLERAGTGVYGHTGMVTTIYLTGAGFVTTLPLALFASAVRTVPLTVIGILQYIAPTLQLASGVLFYREPFTHDQLIGFSGVWAGLVVFGLDGWRQARYFRATATLGAER